MAAQPKITNDVMYQLLRDEKIVEFNARRGRGESCDLKGVNLRGLDLRNLNADGLDLRDAYFHGADLRGIDFRNSQMEGASFRSSNVSGCYFPKELRAEEIQASVSLGIRVRYSL
jgi:uncharacterized protein YjbI with pentapeptide repeats